ncbi:MAG: hypothetical protein GX621_10010, partial [Pirellulaceae bacterium]|nr:hypothetical protein [Pirellulaceae bacterium]
MRNTTAVTLRALVMLACLVLIPAIAVFGKSLPGLALSLLEDGWARWMARSEECRSAAPEFGSGDAGASTRAATDDERSIAPRFGADGSVAPAYASSGAATGSHPAPSAPPRAEVPVGFYAGSDSDTAIVRLPATFPSPSPEGLASPGYAQGSGIADRRDAANSWTSTPSDNQRASGSTPPESAVPTVNGNGSLEGGAFLTIQERLRDMGAVSYRLETWGDRQQLFRFQCEITVHGSPHLTRHFEATDGHPLLAMHKV